MDFFEQLEKGRYGSFELKRQVGPNLLKGLVISLVINGTVIASPFIIARIFADNAAIPAPGNDRVIYLDPPRLVTDTPEPLTPLKFKPSIPDARAMIPKAVPPEDIEPDTPLMPDQGDLKRKLGAAPQPTPSDGDGPKIVYRQPPPDDDPIPDPTIYKVVEIEPQALAGNPQPDYPDLAKISNLDGKVTVQIYVDKHGEVKKWQIVKVTPAGLGFEEEVAKVIPKWRFTPAVQAGSTVGVWVTFPFRFQVKK